MRRPHLLGTLLLMLLCVRGVSQSTPPVKGNETYTLSYDNVPLKRVLWKLKCPFISDAALLNFTVSIQIKDASLQQVIDSLEARLPVRFFFRNDMWCLEWKIRSVKGIVLDSKQNPVVGASVINCESGFGVNTDSKGQFELHSIAYQDTLLISHVNYKSIRIPVNNRSIISINLTKDVVELPQIFIVHNGYQAIPRAQATGSFKQVSMQQVTGIPRFNVQEGFGNNLSGYLPALKTSINPGQIVGVVRGRSSIRSNVNAQALVVIDDFPFHGDLNIINPYDIESITVANDASSTAIWGARAANGIILITTKKNKWKQPLRVSVNSFVTCSSRPNVYYMPAIKAEEYISLEERAYENNFYAAVEYQNVAVSPVIEALIDNKRGNITNSEKDATLNSYKENDLRSEIKKAFYQPAVTEYTGINASGSVDSLAFYGSISSGRARYNETGNEHSRNTILFNTQFRRKKLSFSTGTFYSGNKVLNDFVSPPAGPPYLKLADDWGKPLSVPYLYNRKFVDTAGEGYLLDWHMRPLQELANADNSSHYNYLMANAKIGYQFTPSLQLQGLYQYGLLGHDQRIVYNLETFYARNLINNFSQLNSSGVESSIPLAPIVDYYRTNTRINNWRLQLNFNRRWQTGELTMIGGIESQRTVMNIYGSRIYGYNATHTTARIDYRTFFSQYSNPAVRMQIPTVGGRSDSTDFYFSCFGNAFYTWSKKITMSFSLRRDQSNRFGMNINHQFIPLWAAGALVHLHEFSFYPSDFPYVSLRGTIGKTGNDGLQTSWAATISHVNDPASGLPMAYIDNPGNSNLQFEEMRTINMGMDIYTRDRHIQLSLDVYRKKGDKLLTYNKANSTSGVYLVKSNTGRLSGFGIDANMRTSVNLINALTWETNSWVSYTTNKVQSREILLDEAWQYAEPTTYVSLKGYPIDAVFAFPMDGLDKHGDPVGYLEGKESKNYWSIITSPGPQSLRYIGSATPTVFGSLTNTFQFRNLMLSIQISGKFNYFFRRTSVSPYDLLQGGNIHADYYQRWKLPGDESKTNVPVFPNIIDQAREIFYKYSTVLVERGDHIRLQNLHIMYNLKNVMPRRTKCISIQTGITFNNLGIIWRASRKNIDPDVVSGMLPVPRSITLSIAACF
jgi:TonB-dependent starch-binding outer membrane protein SusC